MINFSDRFKELRIEKQLTQQELGDILNVSRATIAGYETKGKEPNYSRLKGIAEYFNVTLDFLLGKSNIKNPYNENSLSDSFKTPEEAIKFILDDNSIMDFGGFDINKFTDEEKIEVANEILEHLKYVIYKRNQGK